MWCITSAHTHARTRTRTHPFNGPFSGTTQVSRYQKGKTNLDFTEARDSEWQWHQLGHMQVCTLLQTDNHNSTPPICFLQARCPSCHPTNSIKALTAVKEKSETASKTLWLVLPICTDTSFGSYHTNTQTHIEQMDCNIWITKVAVNSQMLACTLANKIVFIMTVKVMFRINTCTR